jgi:hypothetical protein
LVRFVQLSEGTFGCCLTVFAFIVKRFSAEYFAGRPGVLRTDQTSTDRPELHVSNNSGSLG